MTQPKLADAWRRAYVWFMPGIWEATLTGSREEQAALLRWHRDRHLRLELVTLDPRLCEAHRFAAAQIEERLRALEGTLGSTGANHSRVPHMPAGVGGSLSA